jgi:hypothetical protein
MGAPTDAGLGMMGMPPGAVPPGAGDELPPGAVDSGDGAFPPGEDGEIPAGEDDDGGDQGDDEAGGEKDGDDGGSAFLKGKSDKGGKPGKGKSKKASLYTTLAGDILSEGAYIRHLAVLHSGGSSGVLRLVRQAAAGSTGTLRTASLSFLAAGDDAGSAGAWGSLLGGLRGRHEQHESGEHHVLTGRHDSGHWFSSVHPAAAEHQAHAHMTSLGAGEHRLAERAQMARGRASARAFAAATSRSPFMGGFARDKAGSGSGGGREGFKHLFKGFSGVSREPVGGAHTMVTGRHSSGHWFASVHPEAAEHQDTAHVISLGTGDHDVRERAHAALAHPAAQQFMRATRGGEGERGAPRQPSPRPAPSFTPRKPSVAEEAWGKDWRHPEGSRRHAAGDGLSPGWRDDFESRKGPAIESLRRSGFARDPGQWHRSSLESGHVINHSLRRDRQEGEPDRLYWNMTVQHPGDPDASVIESDLGDDSEHLGERTLAELRHPEVFCAMGEQYRRAGAVGDSTGVSRDPADFYRKQVTHQFRHYGSRRRRASRPVGVDSHAPLEGRGEYERHLRDQHRVGAVDLLPLSVLRSVHERLHTEADIDRASGQNPSADPHVSDLREEWEKHRDASGYHEFTGSYCGPACEEGHRRDAPWRSQRTAAGPGRCRYCYRMLPGRRRLGAVHSDDVPDDGDQMQDQGFPIAAHDDQYDEVAPNFHLETGHHVSVGLSRLSGDWQMRVLHHGDKAPGHSIVHVNLGNDDSVIPRVVRRELGCRHVGPEMMAQMQRASSGEDAQPPTRNPYDRAEHVHHLAEGVHSALYHDPEWNGGREASLRRGAERLSNQEGRAKTEAMRAAMEQAGYRRPPDTAGSIYQLETGHELIPFIDMKGTGFRMRVHPGEARSPQNGYHAEVGLGVHDPAEVPGAVRRALMHPQVMDAMREQMRLPDGEPRGEWPRSVELG